MLRVFTPEGAAVERARLLGRARHCRDLASAFKDKDSVQELTALARSYEAKAALIVVEQ